MNDTYNFLNPLDYLRLLFLAFFNIDDLIVSLLGVVGFFGSKSGLRRFNSFMTHFRARFAE
jgi:hypothetical protein